MRLLHGTADRDVDLGVALRLLAQADGPDIRLTIVKHAEHRFSEPENLELLARSIEEILEGAVHGARAEGIGRLIVGYRGKFRPFSRRTA